MTLLLRCAARDIGRRESMTILDIQRQPDELMEARERTSLVVLQTLMGTIRVLRMRSRSFLLREQLYSDTGHLVSTINIAERWYHFAALRHGY